MGVSVPVRVPTVLRHLSGGNALLQGEGVTVGDVLRGLGIDFPGLTASLMEPDGRLKRFVNVFLDGEDVRYLLGLETRVTGGSEIVILPATAGG
jgi:molybdopterin synthase sulfur carrier subunit